MYYKKIDIARHVNIHHYHTKQYIEETLMRNINLDDTPKMNMVNLSEYWLNQKVYKVIETRNYETYVYKVEIVLSTKKLIEKLGHTPTTTIYELIES